MKAYSATGRRGVVAVRRRGDVAVMFAAAAFAPLLAVLMAGTSLAQDAEKDVSTWDKLNSVLVLPPVYRPDTAAANAESEPADRCGEDCSNWSNPDVRQSPTAVAGTADNPANASAGTADNPADNPTDESAPTDEGALAVGAIPEESIPEESGSQQQAAAIGGDLRGPDNLDASLGSAQVGSAQVGSAQDYEAQQAAAQELGASGVAQPPSVIIAAPVRPYYVPRSFAPAAPVFAPMRSLPTSAAWMPQPMAAVAPLPPIVPYGLPRPMAAFPGGGVSRGLGGFRGGFSNMSGFHGGFGRR